MHSNKARGGPGQSAAGKIASMMVGEAPHSQTKQENKWETVGEARHNLQEVVEVLKKMAASLHRITPLGETKGLFWSFTHSGNQI